MELAARPPASFNSMPSPKPTENHPHDSELTARNNDGCVREPHSSQVKSSFGIHRRICRTIGTKNNEHQVSKTEAEGNSCNGLRERITQPRVYDVSEREEGNEDDPDCTGQCQSERQVEVLLEHQADKRAQAEDLPVSEIYDSCGGKNHDQPDGEEAIDQANRETIQNLLPKHSGSLV